MKSKCAVLEFIAEQLILDSELLSDNIRGYKIANLYSDTSAHLMFLKGLAELRGTGTDIDSKKAISTMEAAYRLGSIKAAGVLGYIYDCGECVKQNKDLAFRYYLEAACAGDVDAMVNVAACYYDGVGVEKNQCKANVWMRRAKISYSCLKSRLEHSPFEESST